MEHRNTYLSMRRGYTERYEREEEEEEGER
jgi:hypothetical protein